MPYFAVGASGTSEDKLDQILRIQKEEGAKRKLALIIGGVGALFAAARLGIVVLPLVKAARRRPARR